MRHDRHGLGVLTEQECLRHLRRGRVGRVGFTMHALPVILPVNYAMLGDDVVIRTADGTKLRAALAEQVVCFQVDGWEPVSHEGWSVLVTGRARVLDGDPLESARRLPLRNWSGEDASHYVRITTELVSGRRIVHGAERPLTPLPA